MLILALAALVLEFGVWKVEESFHGPFAKEASAMRFAYLIEIGQEQPLKCCLDSRGDSNSYPDQSGLRLWIDDREMGPAHVIHETIRDGKTLGFSHWGTAIYFRLPPDIRNTAATRATVRYSLRAPRGSTLLLLVASILLGWLAYPSARQVLIKGWRPAASIVLRTPGWTMRALGYAGLLASLIYIACTIAAWISAWALPTTALIRWSQVAEQLAWVEPRLGHVLLTFAALGAAAHWIGLLSHSPLPPHDDAIIGRFFRRWSVPITTCLFVFSMSALWAGIPRVGDLNGDMIGGLIAFSDAGDYLAGAHDQANNGIWDAISLRRPLAAAFRSVLLFVGAFSYQSMLLLQAALASMAICFAADAVARWRGLWAGVAFYALAYIYVRAFVPTALTEPLGLFWALIAIPFFVEALRAGSLVHAVIAFGAMTVALMTRPGSMFTIPALMLWMALEFGRTLKEKGRILALSAATLAGIFGLNTLLAQAYGTGQVLPGANFSYTLCGLTIGKDWSACPEQLRGDGEVLPQSQEAMTAFLYSQAWKHFRDKPGVFFRRLGSGLREFVAQLPRTLVRGYTELPNPNFFLVALWSGVAIVGLLFLALQNPARREVTFWLLLWASMLSSAAFVTFDDGRRVLAVTYPLLWLFLASGFGKPKRYQAVAHRVTRLQGRTAAVGFSVTALFFLGTPWLAHQLSPAHELLDGAAPLGDRERAIFGGRRMSGFLVVPDDTIFRNDLPMIHQSMFVGLVEASGVEIYQGLVHPRMPTTPFGFVFAPRLDPGEQGGQQYIVPPEVIERRDVKAWRIQIEDWQLKPGFGPYWFNVVHAEPLH